MRSSDCAQLLTLDLESTEDDIEEIQVEIAHLSTCSSDQITRYYGSFVRGYRLWIVMEYLAGGSCLDLVRILLYNVLTAQLKPGVFTEAQIAIVCREILLGLQYLHLQSKIHRDIKAANILLSATGEVKLGKSTPARTSNTQPTLASPRSCRRTSHSATPLSARLSGWRPRLFARRATMLAQTSGLWVLLLLKWPRASRRSQRTTR